jgi:hypothetical protein
MILENKIKGQSAIELIILIGAAILFFLGFLYAVQLNIGDRTGERRDFLVRETALAVQDEINLAGESLDGYHREFEVPLFILGNDYDIRLIDSFVFVNTTDGKHATSYRVLNVTGDIQKGANSIRKEDGVVYLNT